MSQTSREELLRIESIGSAQGWVAPLEREDKAYFAYLRTVFRRYNIEPSKAHNLTHDRKKPGGDGGADRIVK